MPVICAGRMDDPAMASAAVADGVCDIVGLARPLLADPFYVEKLRRDDEAAIRPCLSCHEGCLGRMIRYKSISCAVNPECARERYAALTPALSRKRVLVAGGGPAGMEAARVAALRGHDVVLCEAKGRLGGNLVPGGAPAFKEDDHALIAWYEEQLRRAGVEVRLNAPVTAAMAEEGGFDHVIVATGAEPKGFPLDGAPLLAAEAVLLGEADPGHDVVIIGGGLVGCELALHLAQTGHAVTVVEARGEVLELNGPLCPANFEMLRRLLPFHGVRVLTDSQAVGYADGCVTVETPEEELRVPATGVVECVGYCSRDGLYEELRFAAPAVHKIGDARSVANIMNAIWDAHELAGSL